MYYWGRSIRAMLRAAPDLPAIDGDAFVFGAAPDPAVPAKLLETATIVTANASQLSLEAHGITKPHITCMRGNMALGTASDVMKLEKLRGRQTGALVIYEHRSDPKSKTQLALLEKAGYRYDSLFILDRVDRCVVENRQLNPDRPFLLKHYEASMGLLSTMLCLSMGARRVAISGVSFRTDGCSFSDLDYKRIHVDGDLEILARICRLGLPVFAVDKEMATDSGLRQWSTEPDRGGAQAT